MSVYNLDPSKHGQTLSEMMSYEPQASSKSASEEFFVGTRVDVRNYGRGVVRYKGETNFGPDCFFGVELDEPCGKHDGFYNGKRYFHAKPQTGVFVRAARLSLLADSSKDSDTKLPEAKNRWPNPPHFSIDIESGRLTFTPTKSRTNKGITDKDQSDVEDPLTVKLQDDLASTWASNDQAKKVQQLMQLLEREYAILMPRHRSVRSAWRVRSRKRGLSTRMRKRQASNSAQVGNNRTKSMSLTHKTKASLESLAKYRLSIPPRESTVVVSGNGEWETGECKQKRSISNSEGAISEDEGSYSSSWGCPADMEKLLQEIEDERELVLKKEVRIKELEAELKEFDLELKNKTRSLDRQIKRVAKLENANKQLTENVDTAENESEAWRFELLYSMGEHTMMTINSPHGCLRCRRQRTASSLNKGKKKKGDGGSINRSNSKSLTVKNKSPRSASIPRPTKLLPSTKRPRPYTSPRSHAFRF